MRLARLALPDGPRYGSVRDDTVHLLGGPPFGDAGPRETGETVPVADARLLPPVVPSKIFAVGRNYADHAKEMGHALSDEPSVFMKPPSSLLEPGGTVVLPPSSLSDHVEHEAELAVVIGRPARNVPAGEALRYVFGYTCADDVSARDLQRSDTHVIRAKGFDTFCPLGPWVETDADPAELAVRCTVNGHLRQDGNSRDLVFDVPTLIASISAWATLLPGDVILTGSPAGTQRLADGDEVEIEISTIGTLLHTVAATT